MEIARLDIDGTGKWGVGIAWACGSVVLGACVVVAFVVRVYFWWWIGAGVVVFLGFGISTRYAREWREGKSFILFEDRVLILMADSRREIMLEEIIAVAADIRDDGQSGPTVFYQLKLQEEIVEIDQGIEAKNFAIKVATHKGRKLVKSGSHWSLKFYDPRDFD